MIKITNNFNDDIIKEYLDYVVKKIKVHYKDKLKKIGSPVIKQFTMDFLSDENGFSDIKVREFLCKKFKFDDPEMQSYKRYIDYCKEIQQMMKVDILFEDVELHIKDASIIENDDKEKIKDYIEEIKNNTKIKRKKDELKKRVKKLIGAETPIIDYDYLEDDLRHKLILSLNISVCPYCNRQYITSWYDENKKKTTADLDHFYPKSIFPLFALCLYNFIPSCQICNSRMKGDKYGDIIYPYEERFGDDAYFSLTIKNKNDKDGKYYLNLLHSFQGIKNEDLEININIDKTNNKNKIEKSIEIFNLNKVYQSHINYASELTLKKQMYDNGSYIEMMKEQFKNLNLSDAELKIFLCGYNWNENNEDPDRPLSKLAYDILMR